MDLEQKVNKHKKKKQIMIYEFYLLNDEFGVFYLENNRLFYLIKVKRESTF